MGNPEKKKEVTYNPPSLASLHFCVSYTCVLEKHSAQKPLPSPSLLVKAGGLGMGSGADTLWVYDFGAFLHLFEVVSGYLNKTRR